MLIIQTLDLLLTLHAEWCAVCHKLNVGPLQQRYQTFLTNKMYICTHWIFLLWFVDNELNIKFIGPLIFIRIVTGIDFFVILFLLQRC